MAKPNSCSRCGGPLELRHVQGLEVEVCIRCGAAVLDRADLEELTASSVFNAPVARATDPGPVAKTPKQRPKRNPWDYTPSPAPSRHTAATPPPPPLPPDETTEETAEASEKESADAEEAKT